MLFVVIIEGGINSRCKIQQQQIHILRLVNHLKSHTHQNLIKTLNTLFLLTWCHDVFLQD